MDQMVIHASMLITNNKNDRISAMVETPMGEQKLGSAFHFTAVSDIRKENSNDHI